jgi:hypothetical protein
MVFNATFVEESLLVKETVGPEKTTDLS